MHLNSSVTLKVFFLSKPVRLKKDGQRVSGVGFGISISVS